MVTMTAIPVLSGQVLIVVRAPLAVVMADVMKMSGRTGPVLGVIVSMTAIIAHPVMRSPMMSMIIKNVITMTFIGMIPMITARINMMNAALIIAAPGINTALATRFIKREPAMTGAVKMLSVIKKKM